MSSYRITSRYAKSLLTLAIERKSLEAVYGDVLSINKIIADNRELSVMLKSPLLTPDRKVAVLKKIFEGKINELTYMFLTLLTTKGREAHLFDIFNAFIQQYKTLRGITTVTVTSATKLDATTVQNIVTGVKAKDGLNEIDLKEVIDESLIGGYVVEYNNKQIDTSVSRQLHKMRQLVEDGTFTKQY
jgi:F-type H+-transporting ATPase subunit delta